MVRHILEIILDHQLQEHHILDFIVVQDYRTLVTSLEIILRQSVQHMVRHILVSLTDLLQVHHTLELILVQELHIVPSSPVQYIPEPILATSLDLVTTQATMLDLLHILAITLVTLLVPIRIYMEVTSLGTTLALMRERILEQQLFPQKKLYQRLNCGLGRHKHGS